MHSPLWRKSTLVCLCLAVALLGSACGAEDDGDAENNNGDVNNGDVNNGDVNNGDVNNGDANNGDANNGDANNGDDNNGDANNGDANNGDANNGEPEVAPTDAAELATWLSEGSYLEWPAESGPHASTGPHFGQVRTWVNPTLYSSLEAGEQVHPMGSVAIKELYGDSGDVAQGYSVMVKVSQGEGGDAWYWNETYNGSVYANSTGAGICTGCHGGGVDFILTPFPLQ